MCEKLISIQKLIYESFSKRIRKALEEFRNGSILVMHRFDKALLPLIRKASGDLPGLFPCGRLRWRPMRICLILSDPIWYIV